MLNRIRYFHEVVENRSFTRAAETCSISQSAISQQIHSLERELGVSLIHRKGRSFELTPAGAYFYDRTKPVLSRLEEICRETRKIEQNVSFELRIGLLTGMHADIVEEALHDFSLQYPKVVITLVEGNHETLYEYLQSGQVDMAISDQRRAFSQHYHNDFLFESPVEVELRISHPLAKRESIDVEDLGDRHFVIAVEDSQLETERAYWRDIIGIRGDIHPAGSLNAARTMAIATERIFLCEYNDRPGSSLLIRRKLTSRGRNLSRKYHVFWKRDNSGFWMEDLAGRLEAASARQDK